MRHLRRPTLAELNRDIGKITMATKHTDPTSEIASLEEQLARSRRAFTSFQAKHRHMAEMLEQKRDRLREHEAYATQRVAEIRREIEHSRLNAAAIEFVNLAKELDDNYRADVFARFDHLANDLACNKRLAAVRYETRVNVYQRMRREGVWGRPPFRCWKDLAAAWLRKPGEIAA